jgi:hypothetical protein
MTEIVVLLHSYTFLIFMPDSSRLKSLEVDLDWLASQVKSDIWLNLTRLKSVAKSTSSCLKSEVAATLAQMHAMCSGSVESFKFIGGWDSDDFFGSFFNCGLVRHDTVSSDWGVSQTWKEHWTCVDPQAGVCVLYANFCAALSFYKTIRKHFAIGPDPNQMGVLSMSWFSTCYRAQMHPVCCGSVELLIRVLVSVCININVLRVLLEKNQVVVVQWRVDLVPMSNPREVTVRRGWGQVVPMWQVRTTPGVGSPPLGPNPFVLSLLGAPMASAAESRLVQTKPSHSFNFTLNTSQNSLWFLFKYLLDSG